jgi:hypothetical protein
MQKSLGGLALAALVATGVSCGDVVRDGSSPVYLTVDSLQGIRGGPQAGAPSGFLISDVLTNVTSPAPCTSDVPCPTIFGDTGTAQLRSSPRNITTVNGPSSNNDITITRVRVEYIRADGRNTPGVDVPYPFDGAVTVTVPGGGSASIGFELVRNVAKQESPLVQLVTNPNIITAIARITFYGQDRTGNNVTVSGQIHIDFGNFGDF